MSEQAVELSIRRILVALDGSHDSRAALRAAAKLASSLGAELDGLFVEDGNLLRVARLPVARELQFPFATRTRMNPQRMRRQLRAQAERARTAISSIARQRSIDWSFSVVRGDVPTRVLEEAARADLLCLGRASRPVMGQSAVGSTATAAATRASGLVLVASRHTEMGSQIVVLYDGSAGTERALLLASQVAQAMATFLSILVPASASGSTEEIQKQITDTLEAEELMVRYRELTGSGLMSVIHAVHTEGGGTLMLARDFLPPDDVRRLLEHVESPVLLVP